MMSDVQSFEFRPWSPVSDNIVAVRVTIVTVLTAQTGFESWRLHRSRTVTMDASFGPISPLRRPQATAPPTSVAATRKFDAYVCHLHLDWGSRTAPEGPRATPVRGAVPSVCSGDDGERPAFVMGAMSSPPQLGPPGGGFAPAPDSAERSRRDSLMQSHSRRFAPATHQAELFAVPTRLVSRTERVPLLADSGALASSALIASPPGVFDTLAGALASQPPVSLPLSPPPRPTRDLLRDASASPPTPAVIAGTRVISDVGYQPSLRGKGVRRLLRPPRDLVADPGEAARNDVVDDAMWPEWPIDRIGALPEPTDDALRDENATARGSGIFGIFGVHDDGGQLQQHRQTWFGASPSRDAAAGTRAGVALEDGSAAREWAPAAAPSDYSAALRRQVVLIRHGESGGSGEVADKDRVLTDVGREQASRTGEYVKALLLESKLIKHRTVDVLACSDMARAVQTATIIAVALRAPACNAILAPGVAEPYRDLKLNERTAAELGGKNTRCGMLDQAWDRFVTGDDRVANTQFEATTIVVSHANAIRYLLCRALTVPSATWQGFDVAHGSVTVLNVYANGGVTVQQLGAVGHLPPRLHTITNKD